MIRMVVDESQHLIDCLHHVVEIDEQQCLRTNSLNREIDITNEDVGTGIHAEEIRDLSVQRVPRCHTVDFQVNLLDTEVRDVQHDIEFGILVRSRRPTRDLRCPARSARRARDIRRVATDAATEVARRIARGAVVALQRGEAPEDTHRATLPLRVSCGAAVR